MKGTSTIRGIIDADPLIYIIGFGHDDMPLWYQCQKMDEFIESILEDTGATEMALYLTGKGNFREEAATILEYKGNRDRSRRPRFYKPLREYLLNVWDAILVEGMEADDACGIDAYDSRASNVEYVVCSIDKDLLMLEGKHFNYKKREFCDVDEVSAWRSFALQILTGDTSDNIQGLFKVAGKKVTKKIKDPLLELDDPEAMLNYVKSVYLDSGAELLQVAEIASLLWMKRSMNDDDRASTLALGCWCSEE